LLAARLHRRRLGLRCYRCWRHLMLAVHSTQRKPRLLPDRVVATTASAGCVRPQVPEPCWQRSRPQHISPYTHTQRRGAAPAAATFAELRITYANTAPEVMHEKHATGAGSAERAAPSAWAWWRGRGAGSDSRRCPTALLHRVTGVKTHRAKAPNQHRAKAPNQATPLHASRFAEDANQHAEPTVPRRAGGIRQMRAPEWRVGWV